MSVLSDVIIEFGVLYNIASWNANDYVIHDTLDLFEEYRPESALMLLLEIVV
jgi:hypothetical protein